MTEKMEGPVDLEIEELVEKRVIDLLEEIRKKAQANKQGVRIKGKVKGKDYLLEFNSNGDVQLEKPEDPDFPTLSDIWAIWNAGEKIDFEKVSPIRNPMEVMEAILQLIVQLLTEGGVEYY